MTTVPTDALRKTPVFEQLPEEDLDALARLAVKLKRGGKSTVFREGDAVDGFYIVVTGKVKIFKLSEEGKEQVLHVIEPGGSFAEAALFEQGFFPAHAETLSNAEILFFRKQPFLELLEKRSALSLRMLASLSRWLHRMTDLVEDLSLRDVETRLLLFMWREMTDRGIPVKDGATLDLPFGKNVLAARLGAAPETFSRALKKLREEGRISVRGKRIKIISAEWLSRKTEKE